MLILAYLISTALNAETTIMAAYVSLQVHHVQLCKSTGPSCPLMLVYSPSCSPMSVYRSIMSYVSLQVPPMLVYSPSCSPISVYRSIMSYVSLQVYHALLF